MGSEGGRPLVKKDSKVLGNPLRQGKPVPVKDLSLRRHSTIVGCGSYRESETGSTDLYSKNKRDL